jgi:hypothetical protein
MVQHYGRMTVVLLTVAFLAGTALGQNFGGFIGGGTSMLLGNPDVHKELKLNEDQSAKAREVSVSLFKKSKDEFAKFKDLTADQRREKFQELNKNTEMEINKSLKDVFTADQLKRLKQLDVQWRGVSAFMDPEIQKSLKLSEQQTAKLKAINNDVGAEMTKARKDGKAPPKEAMTKMEELRRDGVKKATATLNAEQLKAWKELTGEPFEFTFR